LIEIENNSTELKKDLKNFLLDSIKEVEYYHGKSEQVRRVKKAKKVLIVTVPFVCHKIFSRVARFLTSEFERKLKTQVFFVVKRAIDSKWNRTGQNQTRPRSHTLTQVFENTLDDLVCPAHIVGKRIRVRMDGSKLFKIYLDEKDRSLIILESSCSRESSPSPRSTRRSPRGTSSSSSDTNRPSTKSKSDLQINYLCFWTRPSD
jgi:hypothetical protein